MRERIGSAIHADACPVIAEDVAELLDELAAARWIYDTCTRGNNAELTAHRVGLPAGAWQFVRHQHEREPVWRAKRCTKTATF